MEENWLHSRWIGDRYRLPPTGRLEAELTSLLVFACDLGLGLALEVWQPTQSAIDPGWSWTLGQLLCRKEFPGSECRLSRPVDRCRRLSAIALTLSVTLSTEATACEACLFLSVEVRLPRQSPVMKSQPRWPSVIAWIPPRKLCHSWLVSSDSPWTGSAPWVSPIAA